MKKYTVEIKGAHIEDERIRELSAVPFPRKPVSKEEKKAYIKNFSFFFIVGLVFIIINMFLINYNLWSFSLIVFVISFGLFYLSFTEIFKIPKDMRGKTPKDAITKFIEVVLIGSDSTVFKEKSVEFAFNSLQRMVPEIISPNEQDFKKYIVPIRENIEKKVKSAYIENFQKVFGENDTANGVVEFVRIEENKRLHGNGSNVKAKFKIKYHNFYKSEKNIKNYPNNAIYAEFSLDFDIVMIRSDEFWFFADPMPEFITTLDYIDTK